jgi:hypothetical protein
MYARYASAQMLLLLNSTKYHQRRMLPPKKHHLEHRANSKSEPILLHTIL